MSMFGQWSEVFRIASQNGILHRASLTGTRRPGVGDGRGGSGVSGLGSSRGGRLAGQGVGLCSFLGFLGESVWLIDQPEACALASRRFASWSVGGSWRVVAIAS